MKYFKAEKDKKQFEKLMMDAYNSPISIQADEAEKALEKLINNQSTNVQKMKTSNHGGGGEDLFGSNGVDHIPQVQYPLLKSQMPNLLVRQDTRKD